MWKLHFQLEVKTWSAAEGCGQTWKNKVTLQVKTWSAAEGVDGGQNLELWHFEVPSKKPGSFEHHLKM